MENKPFHILLADDDEGDRLLFTEAFSGLKVKTTVHTVNDGVQLMEWLTREDASLPDFIFLDLNMPKKNGMACLKEIRSNERLKDIFVAIYSTSKNDMDIQETFSQGANVYIAKPNDFTSLKNVLEKAVITAYQYEDQSMRRENFVLRI